MLVVDDDSRCTRVLARLLTEDGFEVSTASGGIEALARMEASPPDALVTDLAMPGLDGTSLLRMTRQRFPRTLVVVISGTSHVPAPLLQGGAIAYVSKPIDIDELVSVLDAGVQLRDDHLLSRR